MTRTTLQTATVLLVTMTCADCASKKRTEPVVWTPKPRVEWAQVSNQPTSPLSDGFRIEAMQPTTGLFPANLGVTRVALENEAESGPLQPLLLSDPRNEFLQWNSTLDDQMAVSEVFPIDQRDLGGGEADTDQILAAFYGLDARLGLIYAVNEISETESEMFGALYDTASQQRLAVLHARAQSVELAKDDEKGDDPYHRWTTDSRALVRAKFGRQVYKCIRQLILNDQSAALESTAGWTPVGPVRPVEWPPRRPRSGLRDHDD